MDRDRSRLSQSGPSSWKYVGSPGRKDRDRGADGGQRDTSPVFILLEDADETRLRVSSCGQARCSVPGNDSITELTTASPPVPSTSLPRCGGGRRSPRGLDLLRARSMQPGARTSSRLVTCRDSGVDLVLDDSGDTARPQAPVPLPLLRRRFNETGCLFTIHVPTDIERSPCMST